MARIFSGIQPSGELHLGNYFGAINNWADLQRGHECIYSVVDLHAMTSDYDPDQLRERSINLAMDLIACGIGPEESVLFVQSEVPEHTELTWIFNVVTSYGDLTRMTQFKEKSDQADFVSAGLFDYPVLQASDILLYKANKVPVGEDQLQHLELTRRVARRFNHRYGDFFPEPEPIVGEGARIMSTADPSRKMSKSGHSKHRIELMEPKDEIWDKVKSAVTDPGPSTSGNDMSAGVKNLFRLLELTADDETVEGFRRDYDEGELMYFDLKQSVFDHLIETLAPIRERRQELADDPAQVEQYLNRGREKASAIARDNMKEVRNLVGIR